MSVVIDNFLVETQRPVKWLARRNKSLLYVVLPTLTKNLTKRNLPWTSMAGPS